SGDHAMLSCLVGVTFGATQPPNPPHAPSHPTRAEIVAKIRQANDGKWYRTVTFTQATTKPNGDVETWYEAATVPGLLRIDIAPLDSGRALVFRSDSLYQIEHGSISKVMPFIHPLMTLAFDIYIDPADRTASRLQGLGFDLTKVHEGTWQDRKVWVIGADSAADTTSKQFWVDQERMLFVRMLEAAPNGKLIDTRFDGYQPLAGGWIETEVLFLVDGQVRGKEEYSDIKAGMTFEEGLFSPAPWQKAGWIGH
ncbi:MAG: hypothetical protein ACHQ2E_07715, partial [Gemmatimonadales bacterium]